jgi:hypothetical protein
VTAEVLQAVLSFIGGSFTVWLMFEIQYGPGLGGLLPQGSYVGFTTSLAVVLVTAIAVVGIFAKFRAFKLALIGGHGGGVLTFLAIIAYAFLGYIVTGPP